MSRPTICALDDALSLSLSLTHARTHAPSLRPAPCRHKYYVDGVRRPAFRGWLHTFLLFFLYPMLCWHMLVNPEVQDDFLAPLW